MNRIPFERYWAAVLDNPIKPKEGHGSYIVRIAELVAGGPLPAAVKDMPEIRLPYRDSE